MSALGGSERKLSLPWLQNGTNAAVFMLPAMRSGRSEKNTVTGLTPSNVSLPVDLSKLRPLALCTNRKSACLGGSSAASARRDRKGATDAARAVAAIKA